MQIEKKKTTVLTLALESPVVYAYDKDDIVTYPCIYGNDLLCLPDYNKVDWDRNSIILASSSDKMDDFYYYKLVEVFLFNGTDSILFAIKSDEKGEYIAF